MPAAPGLPARRGALPARVGDALLASSRAGGSDSQPDSQPIRARTRWPATAPWPATQRIPGCLACLDRPPSQEAFPCVHPCRAEPRHALPLRPPRRRSAPQVVRLRPGAALPHADPGLFAEGRARRSTSSTGSRTRIGNYLARLVFPEQTREFDVDGRPGRRDGGRSTRSTSSSSPRPRHFPFAYDAELAAATSRRTCATRAGRRRASRPASTASRASRSAPIDFLVDAEPAPAAATIGYLDPHGARRADARGDAGAAAAARAATPAGCWCRCCATSASRRASSPAT